MVGDLTKDFSKREFACRCANKDCGHKDGYKISKILLTRLQIARDILGERMDPTCGGRCFTHNSNVGGTLDSSHLVWEAVDLKITSSGYRYRLVFALMQAGFKRIVVYSDRASIHVDVCQTKVSPVLIVK